MLKWVQDRELRNFKDKEFGEQSTVGESSLVKVDGRLTLNQKLLDDLDKSSSSD